MDRLGDEDGRARTVTNRRGTSADKVTQVHHPDHAIEVVTVGDRSAGVSASHQDLEGVG